MNKNSTTLCCMWCIATINHTFFFVYGKCWFAKSTLKCVCLYVAILLHFYTWPTDACTIMSIHRVGAFIVFQGQCRRTTCVFLNGQSLYDGSTWDCSRGLTNRSRLVVCKDQLIQLSTPLCAGGPILTLALTLACLALYCAAVYQVILSIKHNNGQYVCSSVSHRIGGLTPNSLGGSGACPLPEKNWFYPNVSI